MVEDSLPFLAGGLKKSQPAAIANKRLDHCLVVSLAVFLAVSLLFLGLVVFISKTKVLRKAHRCKVLYAVRDRGGPNQLLIR